MVQCGESNKLALHTIKILDSRFSLHSIASVFNSFDTLIQVIFIMTGDCDNKTSDDYTVYNRIAAVSSGQVFEVDKSDVEEVSTNIV